MQMRQDSERDTEHSQKIREAVSIVGGRLSYLSRVSKARDMHEHALTMLAVEKAWLLSQIGLIPDCDDDVMDEQKWSSCSWLLLREFVRQRREDERQRAGLVASGEIARDDLRELPLPKIPYVRAFKPGFPPLLRGSLALISTDAVKS